MIHLTEGGVRDSFQQASYSGMKNSKKYWKIILPNGTRKICPAKACHSDDACGRLRYACIAHDTLLFYYDHVMENMQHDG